MQCGPDEYGDAAETISSIPGPKGEGEVGKVDQGELGCNCAFEVERHGICTKGQCGQLISVDGVVSVLSILCYADAAGALLFTAYHFIAYLHDSLVYDVISVKPVSLCINASRLPEWILRSHYSPRL